MSGFFGGGGGGGGQLGLLQTLAQLQASQQQQTQQTNLQGEALAASAKQQAKSDQAAASLATPGIGRALLASAQGGKKTLGG